jgi:hypothetical protein
MRSAEPQACRASGLAWLGAGAGSTDSQNEQGHRDTAYVGSPRCVISRSGRNPFVTMHEVSRCQWRVRCQQIRLRGSVCGGDLQAVEGFPAGRPAQRDHVADGSRTE